MAMASLWRPCLLALMVSALLSALLPALPGGAEPADYDVANGHFFAQTGKGDGSGFAVLDSGRDASGNGVRFWREFQRLGAVDTLGYPISGRFVGSDGFTYQAFQRGVLQWRPEAGLALLANTFDWLQQAGRDGWLSNLGVPLPVADDGSGGDWQKARQIRLGWLTETRIKERYLTNPTGSSRNWSVDDSIQLYGLPMSAPEKRGPFVVQRFQRVAFQLWVDDVPGMPARGTVVGVLGGDMLKQAGLVPATAATPSRPGAGPSSSGEQKGVYVSYHALGQESYRQHIFDLAATTELNAAVIDIKSERGFTTYASAVPLAKEIGAASRPTVANFDDLIGQFHTRGIYVIGRIPVFKDDLLSAARPAWAVIDSATGQPWHDSAGLGWTDPFHQEVWDYNVALAKEAAAHGVDEVQFDYVRFPVDRSGQARYAQPSTMENRVAAIDGYLARARGALQPAGVKLSADLFGYTAWREDDLGIGQKLGDMAHYLDVVSPMLYPSTFSNGVAGYQPAVAYPYETVLYSLRRAVARLAGTGVVVRPWLQDFPDYAFDRRPFTATEVSAELRGAREGGATGWLLWDPRIGYTREALAPK